MEGRKLAYVSAPLRGPNEARVIYNILLATSWAVKIERRKGWDVYVPHWNILFFGIKYPWRKLNYEPRWLEKEIFNQDIRWLKRCDVLVLCGPTMSAGMKAERNYFRKLCKPIRYWGWRR